MNLRGKNELEIGFPKNSNTLFPGIPLHIDAAFIRNNKVYFISKEVYYSGIINTTGPIAVSTTSPPVDKLPSKIDGVFSWGNHYTYFFSDNKFYKVYGKENMVSLYIHYK